MIGLARQMVEPARGSTLRFLRWLALAGILAACAATRLLWLGEKSIMHDEALFVYYTHAQLYLDWSYTYLPILHGPAMLHLQALLFHLFGASDFTMRLGAALLGIGGLFWILGMRPWLGGAGTWVALTVYTLSPGITFYQRFFRNDPLYVFTSLWIVVSLLWWWRSGRPAWLASAVVGATILFCNKESSLFLYFTIATFLLLVLIHDVGGWLLDGKDYGRTALVGPVPRGLPPLLVGAAATGLIALVLTRTFEGLRYEADVVAAIGHDWMLRDVRSVPQALGWWRLDPDFAVDAGTTAGGGFWRLFYGVAFAGASLAAALFFGCATRRLGATGLATRLWALLHGARHHLAGAVGLSIFLYLWFFTTGFENPTGFFDIYKKTWAYWGGQHEWGRIGGPFHQHLANMVVYELPAVLVVGLGWLVTLGRATGGRVLGLAPLLIALPLVVFDRLLFRGFEALLPGAGEAVALDVPVLLNVAAGAALVGGALLVRPRWSRFLVPAGFLAALLALVRWATGEAWARVESARLLRNGEPVVLATREVDLLNYMEIQFNFDGASSVVIVAVLIVLATWATWVEWTAGRRFRAFLIWWTVTATGAASYAREAVPQVGIHAMLPLILLASSYAGGLWEGSSSASRRWTLGAVLAIAALWNLKATVALNFHHPEDPRETMVYGPTPAELEAHCDFILDYAAIAPIRLEEDGVPSWIRRNNDRRLHKDVQVGVATDAVVWPVRWYLRDIEWSESANPGTFLRQDYPFIFAKPGDEARFAEIPDRYHVYTGTSIRFWEPRLPDAEALADAWLWAVPGHRRDGAATSRATAAWEEWGRLWGYLWRRDVYTPMGEGANGLSRTDYLFLVRKDLY